MGFQSRTDVGSTRPQLTTTFGIGHDNRHCPRSSIAHGRQASRLEFHFK